MVLLELFISYVKVGFCSFGGLSTIPLISDEMLSRGWMTSQQLADMVAIAEMTPGPLGINCATFVGMQVAGVPGAIVASLGVMMPSLTICLLVAHFMVRFKDSKPVQHTLYGIRPVAFALIFRVLFPMARENYFSGETVAVLWPAVLAGAVAALLLFKFKRSIPLVVLVCAVIGIVFVP